jgi:hypothetical protein
MPFKPTSSVTSLNLRSPVNHHVEVAVVCNILNNDTARSSERDKSSPRGNVAEFTDIMA